MKALRAFLNEPVGGRRDTLYLMMAAAGLMSAFPPISSAIASAPPPLSALAQAGLAAAAGWAGFKLGYEALKTDRRRFLLRSSCKVESSDPPAVAPGARGLLLGYTTDVGSPLFVPDEDLVRHGIGGALMGIGGVLASGCSVGQGITGVSTLALGSAIALLAIIIGSALTMKASMWWLMRE